jgi:hypothetical protein
MKNKSWIKYHVVKNGSGFLTGKYVAFYASSLQTAQSYQSFWGGEIEAVRS